MKIRVKVKPGAKKEGVRSLGRDLLEVRVSAPPERGKANERLIDLLSEHFKVRKSAIRILKGETSREKLLEIDL